MWKIPRGGPEAAYVQQLLMAASLVLAAVAASASELLAGWRPWQWPYQQKRLGRLKITWIGGGLWCLILGSMAYWFFFEEVRELKFIYWPSESYSYDFEDSDYGSGNGSSYSYSYSYGDAPPREAKWVEALSGASMQAGLVAMIPISLLGVPLARSSAMWRLAGAVATPH